MQEFSVTKSKYSNIAERFKNLPRDVRSNVLQQAAEDFELVRTLVTYDEWCRAVKLRVFALTEEFYAGLSGRKG